MDASNILKPPLSNGELRCIGSTTFKRLSSRRSSATARCRAASRRSTSASRRSPRRSRSCKGLKPHYEEHHDVTYTDAAIEAAVELSAKHINDSHLPDKAIDVHRRGRARKIRLMPPETARPPRSGRTQIEEVVAKIARIPPQLGLDATTRRRSQNLERELKRRHLRPGRGDRAAGDARSSCRASGLGSPDKPIGSLPVRGPDRRRQDRARQAARRACSASSSSAST